MLSLCCSLVFRLPEWMKFESSFRYDVTWAFFIHSCTPFTPSFTHSFTHSFRLAILRHHFASNSFCLTTVAAVVVVATHAHTHKHRYNNGLHTHSSDTCHTSTTAKSKVPRARQTYKFKQISIHLGATDCRSASSVQSSLIPPPTSLPSKLLFLLAGKFWQHLCLKPHKGLYWFAAKTLIFFGLTNR